MPRKTKTKQKLEQAKICKRDKGPYPSRRVGGAGGAWERGSGVSCRIAVCADCSMRGGNTCTSGSGAFDARVQLQVSSRLMCFDGHSYLEVSKRSQILMPSCLKTDGQGFSMEREHQGEMPHVRRRYFKLNSQQAETM